MADDNEARARTARAKDGHQSKETTVNDASSFSKFVPGFEFLQTLAKNAGSALPGIGQWVAPTLDPAELDKRIGELRTVQFWLEQNARLISTTIQALEVQRMTLATLQTMNVQMDDLRESLTLKMPEATAAAPSSTGAAASTTRDDEEADAASGERPPSTGAAHGAVDPMQWWGALTQQFSQLAASAMQDGGAGAAKNFAESMRHPAAPAAAAAAADAPKAPASRKRATRPAAKRSAAKKR